MLNPQSLNWRARDSSVIVHPVDVTRLIFFLKAPPARDTVETILTTPEPWFEQDTGRLEFVNWIKLWRYLTEDPGYDADYWLTRLEPVEGAGNSV